MLIYLLVVFPAAMVAYGNMTVCELQNSRKDVTQKKRLRGMSCPEVKRGDKGLEIKC